MGELEDDSDRRLLNAVRAQSPTVSKRARSDGEDSGVEGDDSNVPEALRENWPRC